MRKKILTFNHHESYIASLAQTDHDFDVITRYKNLDLSWSPLARTKPSNVRTLDGDKGLRQRLSNEDYDFIVAHTVKNLLWLFPFFKQNYVFIAHIPLYWNTFGASIKSILKWLCLAVFRLTHKTKFVAVSEYKARSWKQGAQCIDLCPLPFEDKEAVNYQECSPVLVANKIAQRGEELGYQSLKSLIESSVPLKIIGNNPGTKGAITPKSYKDFVNAFTSRNVYVFTITQPWGDGYNTAMLEAMNLGMAIISLKNPSSPIEHKKNGLLAGDTKELQECIDYLTANPDMIKVFGLEAQKTVNKRFSLEKFKASWNQLFSSKPVMSN